ncbi:MAG: hypothetical protein HYX92_21345 [Chloroflexi bacterium]|nr:hypothetical protein [Chloroflexota bacterium]
MRGVRSFFYKFGIAGELLGFFWERKLWWLMPIVAMLLALGLLVVFGEATGLAPFIYTLF